MRSLSQTTRGEVIAEWQQCIAKLKTMDEITVEDFGEILIVFGRMRRAKLPVDDGAFALLGLLARQAFEFDGDEDGNTQDELESTVTWRNAR